MDDFAFYLVWLGFFASILLGWYFYLQARHKERMALIEKNADLSEIFKARDNRIPWFKLGMLFLGVGFGLCIAFFLIQNGSATVFDGGRETIALGSILFFGGIGIILAYIIEKRKDN
jgi:hypothetical protein